MAITTPSRRERLRTATVAEIKDGARRLLRTGGPAAISLRAIARDMGMTAPAIYRYFPSLDALVNDLIADLYEEMRLAVSGHREGDPMRRIAEMARSFRRWALANPREFALMFGSPVPGITQFDRDGGERNITGAHFGETFLAVLGEMYAEHPPPPRPPEPVEERLRATVGPFQEAQGERFALPVVYGFLAAWTRLYGLVAMEVFGHLRWALSDVEPLFEIELGRMIAALTDSD